jgi:hypothetical protein
MEIAVVSVTDTIEMKPNRPGTDHAPGLVIVFDGRQCGCRLPARGSSINLVRPDGTQLSAPLLDVKEHGDGRSFFLPGWSKRDVPIGTIASWLMPVVRSRSSELEPART